MTIKAKTHYLVVIFIFIVQLQVHSQDLYEHKWMYKPHIENQNEQSFIFLDFQKPEYSEDLKCDQGGVNITLYGSILQDLGINNAKIKIAYLLDVPCIYRIKNNDLSITPFTVAAQSGFNYFIIGIDDNLKEQIEKQLDATFDNVAESLKKEILDEHSVFLENLSNSKIISIDEISLTLNNKEEYLFIRTNDEIEGDIYEIANSMRKKYLLYD